MYVGVDVGGTKTLVAVLDASGKIKHQVRFPTPKNYDHWLLEIKNIAAHLEVKDFKAGGVAAPGKLDRKHGRIIRCANLPWENVAIQADCEKAFGCPIVIENDANLAALSEALRHPGVEKVLYVTVSTGIGTGVVYKGTLDPSLLDIEGGHIVVAWKDKHATWESIGAGSVIYKHFGKKVADIAANDTEAWEYIARRIGVGLISNIAVIQPDLVIIGGSVGTHFERYQKQLEDVLESYRLPVVAIPKIVKAKQPEEAVVYGCYELAKQVFGHAKATS